MIVDRMIEEGSLHSDPDGFSVEVRMPWYRALPLSSVTKVEMRVDGEQIPATDLTFGINGHTYTLDDLPPRFDEWWYVLDGVELRAKRAGGLPKGDHEVDVQLGIYIPYLPEPVEPICVVERLSKKMVLA